MTSTRARFEQNGPSNPLWLFYFAIKLILHGRCRRGRTTLQCSTDSIVF